MRVFLKDAILFIVLTSSGFCRNARQDSLLMDTIACGQTCIANLPFNTTTFLTPFTERYRKPSQPEVLANADAQAA